MAVYTTIDDPSKYYQTVLYTGDGGANRTINFDGNSDLQPDFLWVKKRSGSQNHYLANTNDSISKVMYSNDTGVEANETAQFKSVHSDGWVQGVDNTNTNSSTFIGWGWKANGGSTTTATSPGNQESVRQANTTAGFSIVTYSGANQTGTFAHGLGAVPHLMIVKCRSATEPWEVYHYKNTTAPETEYIRLNTTAATADSAHIWVDTAPTSTIFTVGNTGSGNESGKTYLAYLWTTIQGYSHFGNYTGNGIQTGGDFFYCGFKPAFLMIKRTDSATNGNWWMKDSARDPVNDTTTSWVRSDLDSGSDPGWGQGSNGADIEFLSNGWYMIGNWNGINGSSATYIWWAFAESPFVTSTGIPATAR